MHYRLKLALCAVALAVGAAHAADSTKPAAPTDATARVPAAKYESAFSGYQSHREQKLAPWRDVNDEVHKAGGHLGIVGGAAGKPTAPHPAGHK